MYKEFSFWKEYGEKYKDYPSIDLYINEEKNKLYDKDKLTKYLNSGGVIAASSKINFPHLFKDIKRSGEFLLFTDGLWIWNEDLSEYVSTFNVTLPDEWYDFIIKNNYEIPQEIKDQQQDVDWDN